MDWRKPPEGATYIGLLRNWEGKWRPFAFGTDYADCLKRVDQGMQLYAMCGARFYGKHIEPYDPNRDYDSYSPGVASEWTKE